MANSTPFLTVAQNQDNTFRVLTLDYQAPVYASTIALVCPKYKTFVHVGTLTGALSISIDVTNTFGIGAELTLDFVADSGGTHVVTFGTGFASPGTLSVLASKYGKASFTYNGTVWVGSGTATA